MAVAVRCLLSGVLIVLFVALQCFCQDESVGSYEDGDGSSVRERPASTQEPSVTLGAHSVTGSSAKGDEEMGMEGFTFLRREGGSSLLGRGGVGGLFTNRRSGPTTQYPLYEVSNIIDGYTETDQTPGRYYDDDSTRFNERYNEVQDYNEIHDISHEQHYTEEGESFSGPLPYHSSSSLTGQHRGSRYQPLGSRIQNASPRYNVGGLFGGRTDSYNNVRRPGKNFAEMCCADCPDRSISCLAVCKRTGCKRVQTCGAAGKGAYAAFCQSRCEVMMGMSFNSVNFLPDEACRGYCSSNVQKLCAANSCTDHGCYAPECAELAPLKCL
eukprot:GHVS01087914.1.p1 GENE.GHVS01087914.1~~GHVS01087914.1.p1  ORF type:complete len:326 (-),score=38.44 GHVS01087914.1:282-1259(-)